MTNFDTDSIIILEDTQKTSFVKKLRSEEPLKNIKVMGLKEFEKKFYFDYTKEAVYHVSKKFNIIKSIAEMYIKNIYYIKNSKEVPMLYDIKNYLIENDLLLTDELFKNYIKGKKIYIYDLKYVDNYYKNMFKELENIASVEYISPSTEEYSKKPIYALDDKNKEVEFLATKISELLKSGIDINRIKIANVTSDYINTIDEVFKDFKIPIELDPVNSIMSTKIVNTFIKNFESNMEKTLEATKKIIRTPRDEKIYKNIIDTVNEYYWADDYLEVKDFIIDDLSKIKTPKDHFENSIKTIDFLSYSYDEDDYIFLINFNQGVFPITKKDEDLLNDNIKATLGLSTTVETNKNTIEKIRKKISETKNLVVSYSRRSINGELYISPAYSEDLFEKCEFVRNFTHSNAHNLKELIKEKDEFRKYGTKSETLITLASHYKDAPYLDYDNTFKGIDKNKIMTHLENKLILSYSSMNTYYMCSFRYYLDNILHMDNFEDTFEITVGNIFHRILSFAFKENFDFETSWTKSLEETEFTFGPKENFFLKILKEELKFIIESINQGMEYTSLKNALYEQKILVSLGDETYFKGFVDKILYGNYNGKDIAVIIDYKTGIQELKLDNAIYGLNMQLPIYAYLLSNYEALSSAHIGGFYLQKILNNTNSDEERREALKLVGYSNSDTSILEGVDSSYESSKIIKSLRTSSNGFYAYSKVLSDNEIETLKKLVETKIKEAASNIKNAKFDINPKEIGGTMYGCKFCKYKDICYMKASNIEKLKSVSSKDFLGGESHANMD